MGELLLLNVIKIQFKFPTVAAWCSPESSPVGYLKSMTHTTAHKSNFKNLRNEAMRTAPTNQIRDISRGPVRCYCCCINHMHMYAISSKTKMKNWKKLCLNEDQFNVLMQHECVSRLIFLYYKAVASQSQNLFSRLHTFNFYWLLDLGRYTTYTHTHTLTLLILKFKKWMTFVY